MPSNVYDFATLEQIDRLGRYKGDERQSKLYMPEGGLHSLWHYNSGLVTMPIAKPVADAVSEPPVKVIRVHAPYWDRQVNWNFGKHRNPAVVPAPVGNSQFVLTGAEMVFPFPPNTTEGAEHDWRASGSYTYVMADSFRFFPDGFETGQSPFLMPSQYPTVISQLGLNTDPDAIYMTPPGSDDSREAYLWRFSDPTIYPGTVFSHTMILGADTEISDLVI